MKRCLIILLMALQIVARAGNWWEEDQPVSPLTSAERGDDFGILVNWADGYLEAIGEASCDPHLAVNQSHCYTMALKAARALAYEKLAENVHGLYISSSNTFEDEVVKNTTLNTAVQGLIKNARIISEDTVTLPDGSLLARVRLGLLINGPQGLSNLVIKHVPIADMSPEISKIQADLQRTREELVRADERANRLERLVIQATEAAETARQEVADSRSDTDAREAVEQAAAAVRLADEARDIALNLQNAAEAAAAQTAHHQDALPSREELEAALAAAQEARTTAQRLNAVAEDARIAAQEARAAGADATKQVADIAVLLDQAQSLKSEMDQARAVAEEARRQTDETFQRLLAAHAELSSDLPATKAGMEEARQAFTEARRARQEIVQLSGELERAEMLIDSLSASRDVTASETLKQIIDENLRLRGELTNIQSRQEEYERTGSAALVQVTTVLESLSRENHDQEYGARIVELGKQLEEARVLQQRVAMLERRTVAVEEQAAISQSQAMEKGQTSEQLQQAMGNAAQAVEMVHALIDSLRTAESGTQRLAKDTRLTTQTLSESNEGSYSGLIVDAAHLNARASLKPRIFSVDGQELYGERTASREVALSTGFASWSDTPETAREKAVKRIGTRPLVVKAVDATGKYRSDLVVSREDALLIERANQRDEFLRQCRVAITILPQA